MSKPILNLGNLEGPEGNAFVVLGRAKKTAIAYGWSKEEIEAFMAKATASNYENLLKVVREHFKVYRNIAVPEEEIEE
jgi:hypothetical protein